MATPSFTAWTLYRRLLGQARPYWPHLAGLFLLSLLASPLALLTPLPLKMAVDSVVGSHQLPGPLAALLPAAVTRSHTALLVVAAVLFVLIALLTQLQQLGSSVLSAYTGEKLVLGFRVRLFRHVQRLSLLYHDAKGTTDSTYRIQYDASCIQNIAVDGVIPFITTAITVASMIYVTARIDWQLALVALAVSPVLFLVARAYRQRLRRRWGDAKRLESCAMSVVQEVLAAMRVVKAFGQENYEQERFICQSSKGLRARVHLAFVAGSFGLLVGLITAVGTAAVLFLGMRHVQAGVLTLGELLVVMSYLAQLYIPLQTISKKAADLQASLASAERAFALLEEAPDVTERPNARQLVRALGTVAFRKVCFAYSKDLSVLHDISFEIDPGTHLGIAGTTGAGKTTLVSLLTRFYDPTAGQVLLDGVDLRDYKLADLRNQFSIVLQEPVLFSSSIAENIAYARPGASHHEIVAAAKAANAHEFIVGLPQGYATQVGERGMRLSGGERQRISLARAFLKDAPILVLDEPTSSVDTKTEAAIMEAMERLMQGRTTFIIAHRLGTLANCDARLRIEQGRLNEATLDALIPLKEALAHGGRNSLVIEREEKAPVPEQAEVRSTTTSVPVRQFEQRTVRSRKPRVLLPISAVLLVGIILGGLFSFMIFHGSRSASPTSTLLPKTTPQSTAGQTVTPAPSPSSITSVNLAESYKGIMYNVPLNLTTDMSLTRIQQSQRAISGYFIGSQANGLQVNEPFKGMIDTQKHIQFTVAEYAGQVMLSFDGSMRSDGALAGNYCSLNQQGQCAGGEYGLWSVSPQGMRNEMYLSNEEVSFDEVFHRQWG